MQSNGELRANADTVTVGHNPGTVGIVPNQFAIQNPSAATLPETLVSLE